MTENPPEAVGVVWISAGRQKSLYKRKVLSTPTTGQNEGYLKVVPNEVKFHDGTEQNAAYSLDF